jgi:hypothetical protein
VRRKAPAGLRHPWELVLLDHLRGLGIARCTRCSPRWQSVRRPVIIRQRPHQTSVSSSTRWDHPRCRGLLGRHRPDLWRCGVVRCSTPAEQARRGLGWPPAPPAGARMSIYPRRQTPYPAQTLPAYSLARHWRYAGSAHEGSHEPTGDLATRRAIDAPASRGVPSVPGWPGQSGQWMKPCRPKSIHATNPGSTLNQADLVETGHEGLARMASRPV